ncbi:MAG: anhydro-N-acetylmuramic acid kinase [Bacteroidales bacterium]|nr:anhydro-N-acetylmuramic acid kinase [Bacteroidales bacterium]MDD3890831.1 anhydro-N-acetylmuramic acid kinase [Bacteroidales bacterium]
MQPASHQNISAHNKYVIGLMSGTSLDGLDICLCRFVHTEGQWSFEIVEGITIDYSHKIKQQLINSKNFTGEQLWRFHCDYGKWIGKQVHQFMQSIKVHISLIGSHGHTVFHNPQNGYTAQIGHGAYIAAETGIPCVCDFRSGDIAHGGQGAPLVPIGDELLFSEYHFCINLGGIANISFSDNQQRVAYDICPANMAINLIANRMGFDMDKDGTIAKSGTVDNELLNSLNQIAFYKQKGAKSLGREWFEEVFEPIIKAKVLTPENTIRTIYEHIAIQISLSTNHKPTGNILVTGGGANNKFLIKLISKKCTGQVIVPSPLIVDYKEALIFGFLAILYQNKIASCLSSATGARMNSIGGCLYF